MKKGEKKQISEIDSWEVISRYSHTVVFADLLT